MNSDRRRELKFSAKFETDLYAVGEGKDERDARFVLAKMGREWLYAARAT